VIDLKLLLLAYVLPGLAVLLGIPMALGLIPPNRFYGYRTRKTFSSREVWYRANRFCGWAMVIAGISAVGYNLWLGNAHGHLPAATQQLFIALSTAILLLVAVAVSALYVRKL
jgi:uncharacterized membrane protein